MNYEISKYRDTKYLIRRRKGSDNTLKNDDNLHLLYLYLYRQPVPREAKTHPLKPPQTPLSPKSKLYIEPQTQVPFHQILCKPAMG